jgi:hypothetical protein
MTTTANYPNVIKVFYDFLSTNLYPSVDAQSVFYANQNNITLPENNDYCIYELNSSTKTATTIETYNAEKEQLTLQGKLEIVCHVDIYCSSQNGDTNLTALQRAQNIAMLFKSVYGVSLFKGTDVTPLYPDEVQDTSLPNSDSGNYLYRASVNLHAYINHSLTLDVEGFNKAPQIILNSILAHGSIPVGDDLHVANVDVKIKV